LVVLFAIIAILRPGARAVSEAAGGALGCCPPPQPQSQLVIIVTLSAVITLLFIVASPSAVPVLIHPSVTLPETIQAEQV
jgi:hypothetical protein